MNKLVEELKNSFIASLIKTAEVLNISIGKSAFQLIKDKVDSAFKSLDDACTEFGKILLLQVPVEDKDPEDLTLVFSGKNGGKIYCTPDPDAKLIINDELLITKDLKDLSKSFYSEDYLEASKFNKLIKEKGIITLKEYRK